MITTSGSTLLQLIVSRLTNMYQKLLENGKRKEKGKKNEKKKKKKANALSETQEPFFNHLASRTDCPWTGGQNTLPRR
ncbi:hypothetical protein I7I48_04305 [Histoplasma ohiense]|nr:hypothetical protein I7I48_04305 [Histoplasma ohiense (nom. inval.)]